MRLDVLLPRAIDVVTLPPGSTFGPRHMADWQFLWFLEGDCIYERDDKRMDVPQGSLLFCVPGATERFWWDPRRNTRCFFVHFDIRAAPTDWPPYLEWNCLKTAREGDVFTFGFQHLLSLWHQEPRDELSLRLCLALLVSSWREPPAPRAVPGNEVPVPVERALQWMHDVLQLDPARPITLTELAAAAYVTPPYLCRVFAASTGRSPLQTVMLARLDHALELVTRSDLALERVAAHCGFADAAHLSRRFRAAYGTSPLECRRRVRQGHLPPEYCLTRRLTRVQMDSRG